MAENDFQYESRQPSWILEVQNKFFQKPMQDFLLFVNRDHTSKLLIFLENCIYVSILASVALKSVLFLPVWLRTKFIMR